MLCLRTKDISSKICSVCVQFVSSELSWNGSNCSARTLSCNWGRIEEGLICPNVAIAQFRVLIVHIVRLVLFHGIRKEQVLLPSEGILLVGWRLHYESIAIHGHRQA